LKVPAVVYFSNVGLCNGCKDVGTPGTSEPPQVGTGPAECTAPPPAETKLPQIGTEASQEGFDPVIAAPPPAGTELRQAGGLTPSTEAAQDGFDPVIAAAAAAAAAS